MDNQEQLKIIPVKEFRELGYLQELNRQFLHPLGLAISIIQYEDGSEGLGGIWDYRNDPEGIIYDINNSESERKERFLKNKKFIQEQFDKYSPEREKLFGTNIEPIE
jgi:hypothetical protein